MSGALARRAIIVIAVVTVAAMSTLVVRARQLDVNTETAVIARLAATVGAVETLAGQAIVAALDAPRRWSSVPTSGRSRWRAWSAPWAISDRSRPHPPPGPSLETSSSTPSRIASDLRAGNPTDARTRFETDLAEHRANLDGVVGERIADLDTEARRLDDTARRLAWASIAAATWG
jgi:hypothetical protein